MPPVQRRFLSIFIVRYHQSTFTPFYLQYINMTLKNILLGENSRATLGPCCLINRDFKRQCRISMVLQGSAKGQARGEEERGGEEDRLLWTLKRHCVDTSTFQAQAGEQKLLSFSKIQHQSVQRGQTTNYNYYKATAILIHKLSLKQRKEIQLCQRQTYSTKSKDKKMKKQLNFPLFREGTKTYS